MSWWFHKNKPVEKSFEFLDCVVNQIETGIVCLTHDYKVLYMNKKMREQLKIEKDNNTEIDFFDFIPEEEKKQFEYIFKNIRFSKTATFTLKLKINNIVELYECLGKYEKNESKDFYTFSLISPAKYQQNARQLANAQKFEILGRLTSGFAHDFNNLLAAAIGYITLLKQPDKKSEKLDLYLDKLDTVLSDGANSLRKILLFSRSEIEELKPINLKTFITELLDFIDKLIRSNIKIDVKIPAESVYVNSSPTKLEQVIINLLINARDAIEGPGKISIKTS
ncbi:MAG: PAS domain-containing protein, partial [Calditrichia bacterium]|nr:PAS domain-containing protein [Calditrichia bacterium]